MTPEVLEQQLARQLERLAPPAEIASAKQAALAAFNAVGFPTRRHESWKYTDLKALTEGEFDLTSPAPETADEEAAAARIAEAGLTDGPRLVFIDGHYSAALSSRLPDGLELEPVTRAGAPAGRESISAPGGRGAATSAAAARRAGAPTNEGADSSAAGAPRAHALAAPPSLAPAPSPLATLNAAFTHRGVALRAPRGVRVAGAIALVFVGTSRPRMAPQLKLTIELGEQAELTLVQHFVDAGEADSWLNAVIDVVLRSGSRLTLYRLQEHGPDRFQTSLLNADLARDASLTAGYVEVGGRLVRNDVNVSLNEPGASADLFGVTLGTGERLLDNHLRVDHRAPHTTSAQTFRGVADDSSRVVFNGKVVVHEYAQKIDARQASDNLLLSKRAEVDTRPQLEIYADDVKCSHGATVGELDEQQLFYLRTRGIDARAARGLLTFAFANSVLGKIGIERLRETAAERVAGVLPDRDRWEQLA